MEAVPRLPMISFPSRTSVDASELAEQLKKYIRIHYHEDPESYNNEIYELESLRRGAINASTDFIGCSTLKKYYCQLHYLSSRFPFDESGLKVSFNWFSAFDQNCSNSGDILFEMESILYNIASLHTVLGSLDTRTTSDGMKISCTHFQCASWAFQVLSQNSKGDSELNPLLMSFMMNFTLSQAQECILEKSMTDNRKPNIIAKVSMQVVEYLRLTLKNLESFKKSNGFAVDLVGSKLMKIWQRHCEFKIAYYYSVTYFHQGLHSEEQQKMGERLAYFQGAVEKLDEASKISKNFEKAKQISETLTFANDVIQGKLTAGQKENEFVYHEKVPPLASLPDVKGASLVKGISFNYTDSEVAGPDIFSRLVPMEAHQASSMYSEEKAKLLRSISSQIQEKNEELETYLASMQLDSLTVEDNLDSLPQELVECCADLNSRDAMRELTGIMGNINHVYHEIKAKIKELLHTIQEEEQKEKEFGIMMRIKKAPNQLLNEHKREGLKYKEAHEAAQSNNQALHTVITQHRDNITLLSQSLNQLVEALPSAAGVESETDRLTRMEVQRLLNKVGEMQLQRREFEAQLRKNLHEDDITKQLVTSHEDMEDFFKEQLAKHSIVVSLLEQNMAAQSNILQALSEANASYGATRRQINKVKSQRSEIIASLIGSYNTFISITHKAQDADEFYSKLDIQVNKLHNKVKSLCKVQEEEREEKLAANVKKFGGGHKLESLTSQENISGPKLKDYLQSGSGMKGLGAVAGNFSDTLTSTLPTDYGYNAGNMSGMSGPVYPADVRSSGYSSTLPVSGINPQSSLPTTSSNAVTYGQTFNATSYYTPSAPTPAVQQYLDASSYPSGGYSGSLASVTPQPPSTVQSNSASSFPSTNSSYAYIPSTTAHASSPSTGTSYPASVDNNQVNANYQNTHTQSNINYSPSHGQYATQYQTQSGNKFNNFSSVNSTATVPTNSSSYSENYFPNVSMSGMQSTVNLAAYYPGNFVSQAGSHETLSKHSSMAYGSPYSEISSPSSKFSNRDLNQTAMSPTPTTRSQINATYPIPCTTSYSAASYGASSWTSTPPCYAAQSYKGNVTSTTSSQGHEQENSGYANGSNVPVPTTVPSSVYNYNQFYNATAYSQNSKSSQPSVSSQGQFPNTPGNYNPYNQSQDSYVSYQQNQASGNYGAYSQINQTHSEVSNSQVPGVTGASYIQRQEYSGTAELPYPQNLPNTVNSMPYNQEQGAVRFGQTFQAPSNIQPNHPYNSTQYATGPYPLGYQNVPQTSSQTQLNVQPIASTNSKSNDGSEKKGFSNLDLLAGIELNVSQAPLIPKSANSNSNPTIVSSNIGSTVADFKNLTLDNLSEKSERDVNPSSNNVHHDQISSVKENSASSILDLTKLAKQAKRSASVLDPLSNDETLSILATETERFSKFVQGLDKKSLNGPTNLEIKWKELTDILEVNCASLKVSVGRCYPLSNRFPDNLPFDVNRVKLPSARDDYINASYVQLKSVEDSIPMILTQAPMTNTTNDFWTMVWENQVEIIVCMNTEAEVKGHSYYPKELSETIEYGHFSLTLKQVRRAPNDCWLQRTFQLIQTNQKVSKVVLHMQFLTWPPSAMPESPGPLLQFVNEVHNLQKQQRNKLNPMVIHCVSGTGRSGVFAVLSSYIKFLQATGSLADVWNLIIELSEERKTGILDRWHLLFLYSAALYYAQEVLMKRGILTDKATFEEGPREKTHVRHPSADLLSSDLNRIKAKLGFESESPSSETNLSRSGSQSSIVSASSQGGVLPNVTGSASESGTPPPPAVMPSTSPTHSVLSEGKATKIGSTMLPPNLAASMDPDMLVLVTPNPPKAKKITKESFFLPANSLGHGEAIEDDPFSVLDPMWNLKKN